MHLRQMFDGDLYDGLRYIAFLFEEETKGILKNVHIETRLFFGVYMGFVSVLPHAGAALSGSNTGSVFTVERDDGCMWCARVQLLLVFYWSLFLSTLKAARAEVVKAQEFAYTVPLHVLEGEEAATVKAFYMRDNGLKQGHQDADSGD